MLGVPYCLIAFTEKKHFYNFGKIELLFILGENNLKGIIHEAKMAQQIRIPITRCSRNLSPENYKT
jgi:hypothetical protein